MSVFVCSLSPPRSFDGSSPNLVGVCRWTSHLPLRGSFSKRSTGRRVNGSLSLSTILYMCQPHATRCNSAFCFAAGKQQSLILLLLLYCISTTYVGAPRNCPLFLKGQRVDGSVGQTGHISTVFVGGPRNCLEGFFFEKVNRSTGQRVKRVDGSMGQTGRWVNRWLSLSLYYIWYPGSRHPAAKKHTAYDDTRLTPHRCKKQTASFARSTGKFPSDIKY